MNRPVLQELYLFTKITIMKKLLTLLMTVCFCLSVFAQSGQTTKTITWGDNERQYIEYVPANVSNPAPVLFVLHGLGDDMSNMFNSTGFKAIADAHGWIVVIPQALEAIVEIPMMGSTSIGTAWNSGVSGNIPIVGNIVVNENVDDAGFLLAILDDLIATYNVDQNNVFSTGFSMGGFMSNRMAIEHADRFKAIASVSGTIGNVVSNATPSRHINTMHFHGTADEMVSYENAELSYSGISFSVGLGAEATVDFWKNANGCAATPSTYNFPDNASDGLTFEKFQYDNANEGIKTVFVKVNGGTHTWYYTPNNDIDYTTEIYNFFASCMGPTSVGEVAFPTVNVYPNPTKDMLHVEAENITNIQVYNALGQLMVSTTSTDIPVSSYSEGLYTVSVTFANGRVLTRKVMVK